jgi:hypothetical protein
MDVTERPLEITLVNTYTGIVKNNVHNFLDTCQSLGNSWSTNIFGGPNFIVTLENWRKLANQAFITNNNIRKSTTVIFRKYVQ